jgi:hypothetical protein
VPTQVVSPLSPPKGHRVQPSPATLGDSHGTYSRAVSPSYTSALRGDNAKVLMFSQPSPSRQMTTTVIRESDNDEDEMSETRTSRPRSEGSNHVGSSGGSSTPQRKRPVGNDRKSWRIPIPQPLADDCIRYSYPRMVRRGSGS